MKRSATRQDALGNPFIFPTISSRYAAKSVRAFATFLAASGAFVAGFSLTGLRPDGVNDPVICGNGLTAPIFNPSRKPCGRGLLGWSEGCRLDEGSLPRRQFGKRFQDFR